MGTVRVEGTTVQVRGLVEDQERIVALLPDEPSAAAHGSTAACAEPFCCSRHVQRPRGQPAVPRKNCAGPPPARPAAEGDKRYTLRAKGLLSKLPAELGQRLGVDVLIDRDACQQAGISLDQPVSVDVNEVIFDELFAALLKPAGLLPAATARSCALSRPKPPMLTRRPPPIRLAFPDGFRHHSGTSAGWHGRLACPCRCRPGCGVLNQEGALITKITGRLAALGDDWPHLAGELFRVRGAHSRVHPAALAAAIGQEISLHTIDYLEGNPMQGRMTPRLIGFLSEVEREFFELFCSVDGVGVRKALRAMVRPVKDVATAIEEQDTKFLSIAAGHRAGHVRADHRQAPPQGAEIRPDGRARRRPARPTSQPDVVSETYEVLRKLGHAESDARRLLDTALGGQEEIRRRAEPPAGDLRTPRGVRGVCGMVNAEC